MPRRLPTALAALTALTALGVGASACANAGEDRILGITGTGVVNGFAFFDRNGNRVADQTVDTAMVGVRVALVARGTRDTAATATSGADGTFRVSGLPVGTYEIVIDSGTFGDSILVVRQDSATVTVPPADSVFFRFGVSFPKVSIAEFRTLPQGKKVFIEGVALADLDVYGDTTLHVADTSGSLRAVRVRRTTVFAGDSIRLLGMRNERSGQPVIDDATVFGAGFGPLPPPEDVTTAQAATADGGQLDAAFVRVRDAVVSDTVTVAGDLRMTVDDGSGALVVVLDGEAGLDPSGLDAGVSVDVLGLLVPDGLDGWVLKPRTDSDLTVN